MNMGQQMQYQNNYNSPNITPNYQSAQAQTPNYFSNYNARIPNNYMNQMNGINNGQVQENPSIPGRVINNPSEIKPNEVPMDGTVSLFPLNDLSCIYSKVWGPDGSIKTIRFVPEIQNGSQNQKSDSDAKFDQLMAMLGSIEQSLYSMSSYRNRQNTKKNNFNRTNNDRTMEAQSVSDSSATSTEAYNGQ